MEGNTLNKSEKLKSRKSIESLFQSGHALSSPPFKLIFRKVEDLPHPMQMTVAIPKRLIKRAVDRNLLKRRTREAYRLKKNDLYTLLRDHNVHYEILFLYQASEIKDFKAIYNSVNFLLLKLSDRIIKD